MSRKTFLYGSCACDGEYTEFHTAMTVSGKTVVAVRQWFTFALILKKRNIFVFETRDSSESI